MAANWGLADPNAFSRQITNHITTPQENLNVLAQQQEMQQRGQQIQQNKLALKSQQLQVGDQEAVRGAWQQAQGDGNKFLENLKVSAPHLYDKARLEMAGRAAEETAKAIAPLNGLPPEQRAQAWPQVRQRLIQMGHNPQSEPALGSDQYPGDQWVALNMGQVMDVKDQVAAQQKATEAKETGRHNTATETNTANTFKETQRHNRADEGIAAKNASTAAANAEVNRQLKDAQVSKAQNEVRQINVSRQKAAADIDNAIKTVDAVGAHPGFSASVGVKNPFKGSLPLGKSVPGSSVADFQAKVKELQSQTFLQSVQAMRGTGPLSDREGAKVEAAIANLDTDQSEKQMRDQLVKLRGYMLNLKQISEAEGQFSGAQQPAAQQQPQQPIWREVQ